MLTNLYSYRLSCNLKAVEMMTFPLQLLKTMEMMPPTLLNVVDEELNLIVPLMCVAI
jgi:hypothetical protein